MLKLIRYMFYRSYKITLKVGKKKDPFPTLGLIGMPIIINGLTLFNLLMINSDLTIDLETKSYTLEALICAGLLFYFLFRYLATKDRILAIFREFGRKSKTQKWILNICVIVYLILTVYLFDYSLDLAGVP